MKTENNILMAEFMGIADEIETGATSLIQIEGITGYYKNNNLKFHTDWNWLMKVVEKCLIGEAEHSQDEAKKAISEIYESLCSINISAVYNACIGFIKWYNQQKN